MKNEAPIQFKGTSLKIIQVQLRAAEPALLAESLAAMTGGATDFFDGELAVIDLSGLPADSAPDFAPIVDLLRRYGLQPAAVIGAEPRAAESAAALGLACLAANALGRPARQSPAMPSVADPVTPAAPAAPVPTESAAAQAELPLAQNSRPAAPPVAAAEPPAAPSHPSPTLIVDKPLRSGQRAYAKGGDLVVLAMVSAGAEVIADGNIHVYAPLRGRALAGAAGDATAKIFTTSLEAELVSVAGIYRTFESGLPDGIRGKPAWIGLAPDADALAIEPLSIR